MSPSMRYKRFTACGEMFTNQKAHFVTKGKIESLKKWMCMNCESWAEAGGVLVTETAQLTPVENSSVLLNYRCGQGWV